MRTWEFAELRVGRLFLCNGNDYVKQSTRTARMLSNGRVFYFGRKEIIYPNLLTPKQFNNNHEDTTMRTTTTKNTTTTTTPRARGISVKLQATTYQHVLAVKKDIEEEMGIHLSLTQALAVIVLRYRILDPKTPNLI